MLRGQNILSTCKLNTVNVRFCVRAVSVEMCTSTQATLLVDYLCTLSKDEAVANITVDLVVFRKELQSCKKITASQTVEVTETFSSIVYTCIHYATEEGIVPYKLIFAKASQHYATALVILR